MREIDQSGRKPTDESLSPLKLYYLRQEGYVFGIVGGWSVCMSVCLSDRLLT